MLVRNIPVQGDYANEYTKDQIHDLSYIHFHNHFPRVYYKLTSSQLPDGLIAQLVEHCTDKAEVIGSNPVQARIFFQALISQLPKLR